jgi:PAS domain S-box-containing protein
MTEDRQVLSKIESLLRQHPKGLSTSAITRHLNGNRNSTAKYLEVLLSSGVTERKQVGASRVYTLTKRISLKSLMNYMSEYIIVLDSRSRIITINESLLRFFDVPREALEGKYLHEVPVDLLRPFHGRDSLCNPAREMVTEIESVIAGQTCYFRARCLPTQFEGNDTGYTILIDNISDQKRHEQKLVESEAKYRAVIEAQTDIICRRRSDGTITFVNNEFLQFFSKKAGEVVGSQFYPVDLQLSAKQDTTDISFRILPFYKEIYEQAVLLDHGEIHWLQWKNTSLSDSSGTITEIQSVGRDVTVQRQREREILLKRCSIESSEYAMVIFDLVGRIVYANRSFLVMFRCRDDLDVIGRPFDLFVQQSGPGNNVNQLAQTLMQTGKVDCFVKGKRLDTTDIDLEFHGTQIRNDLNFPLHTLCLMIDRTGTCPPGCFSGKNAPPKPASPPQGILLLDPSGLVVSVNRDFLNLAGYEDEYRVLGKPVGDLLGTGPESPEVLHTPAGTPDNGKTRFSGGQVLHHDGSFIPVGIAVRHIRDTGGMHLCSEIIAEPAGSQPPVNVDNLTDLLPVPLFVIDRQKRVILWNPAMEVFTGVRREEVVGTTGYRQAFYPFFGVEPQLIDLVDQPFDKIHQIYPNAKKYGDTIILERYLPDSRKTEGTYFYEKACLLYDPEGNVIGSLGGITDITDWKRSQEFMNRMKDEIEAGLNPRVLHLQEMIGNVPVPVVDNRTP